MGNNILQKVIFLLVLSITFQLTYCRKKKSIEGFDTKAWTEDVNGCQAKRAAMMDDLLKIKFKLRGQKIGEIKDILGRPDAIELYKRDQKYYIYYMEPGVECSAAKEDPLKLYVRFTAVGIANELSIRN